MRSFSPAPCRSPPAEAPSASAPRAPSRGHHRGARRPTSTATAPQRPGSPPTARDHGERHFDDQRDRRCRLDRRVDRRRLRRRRRGRRRARLVHDRKQVSAYIANADTKVKATTSTGITLVGHRGRHDLTPGRSRRRCRSPSGRRRRDQRRRRRGDERDPDEGQRAHRRQRRREHGPRERDGDEYGGDRGEGVRRRGCRRRRRSGPRCRDRRLGRPQLHRLRSECRPGLHLHPAGATRRRPPRRRSPPGSA